MNISKSIVVIVACMAVAMSVLVVFMYRDQEKRGVMYTKGMVKNCAGSVCKGEIMAYVYVNNELDCDAVNGDWRAKAQIPGGDCIVKSD